MEGERQDAQDGALKALTRLRFPREPESPRIQQVLLGHHTCIGQPWTWRVARPRLKGGEISLQAERRLQGVAPRIKSYESYLSRRLLFNSKEEFLFQVKHWSLYEPAIRKAGTQGCIPLDQPGLVPITPEMICLPWEICNQPGLPLSRWYL